MQQPFVGNRRLTSVAQVTANAASSTQADNEEVEKELTTSVGASLEMPWWLIIIPSQMELPSRNFTYHFTAFEALSASGLRAIRYAKEIPFLRSALIAVLSLSHC